MNYFKYFNNLPEIKRLRALCLEKSELNIKIQKKLKGKLEKDLLENLQDECNKIKLESHDLQLNSSLDKLLLEIELDKEE